MKSVFKKNPNWWGLKEKGYFDGNVDEIVYTPVKEPAHAHGGARSPATSTSCSIRRCRTSTSSSRTSSVKVYDGRENRIIFLGIDQNRDELLYSNVKGKNPFKDKRVRQAFYQAIDVNAINKTVMRGLSMPTGDQPAQPRR